jgi:hypothetical protein
MEKKERKKEKNFQIAIHLKTINNIIKTAEFILLYGNTVV